MDLILSDVAPYEHPPLGMQRKKNGWNHIDCSLLDFYTFKILFWRFMRKGELRKKGRLSIQALVQLKLILALCNNVGAERESWKCVVVNTLNRLWRFRNCIVHNATMAKKYHKMFRDSFHAHYNDSTNIFFLTRSDVCKMFRLLRFLSSFVLILCDSWRIQYPIEKSSLSDCLPFSQFFPRSFYFLFSIHFFLSLFVQFSIQIFPLFSTSSVCDVEA